MIYFFKTSFQNIQTKFKNTHLQWVVVVLLCHSYYFHAQANRGIKIAYIDMEYILENTSSYTQAISMIDQKAQKWKEDIESKEGDIKRLRGELKTEQILLTQELIDEKIEEIELLEAELNDIRQKRFGPNGDFFVQKTVLIKPIQDQVFTIVQDIAEARKYDFVFDKASDLTMLFAAKRFDISDLVVKQITRSEKRENLSKKQLEKLKEDELKEDEEVANPALAERRKRLEEKKAERERMIEERKLAQEAKKKEVLQAKNKKSGTVLDNDDKGNENTVKDTKAAKTAEAVSEREEKLKEVQEARKQSLEERQKAIQERKDELEKRKKELQDQRAKALEERNNKLKEKQNSNKED